MATLRVATDPAFVGAPTMLVASSTVADVKKWHLSTEGLWAIASVALVVVGYLIALSIQHWVDPKPIKMGPDVSVFALLYIAAQALERVMEPLASILLTTKEETKAVEAELTKVGQALGAKKLDDAKAALQAAADATAKKDTKRIGRSLFYWAVATSLALIISAFLGLYLVQMITTANPPNRELDLLITGLAIGGGTKPLHDLITRIEKAKNAAQDQPAAA